MKVIIYGTEQCGFCTKAKDLCESKHLEYDYHTVGFDITAQELQEKVGRPIRTVPQIFVMQDGFAEYVGGYDQLAKRLA